MPSWKINILMVCCGEFHTTPMLALRQKGSTDRQSMERLLFSILMLLAMLTYHFATYLPIASGNSKWVPFIEGALIIIISFGLIGAIDYYMLEVRGMRYALIYVLLSLIVFYAMMVFLYPHTLIELGVSSDSIPKNEIRDFAFLVAGGYFIYILFYKYGDKLSEPGELREPWKEKKETENEEKRANEDFLRNQSPNGPLESTCNIYRVK